MKPKPRRSAIIVNDHCHYYENRGSLKVFISQQGLPHTFSARIPWKLLLESAKLCRPEAFTKKGK